MSLSPVNEPNLSSSKTLNINQHLASVCDKCFQNIADNYNILSFAQYKYTMKESQSFINDSLQNGNNESRREGTMCSSSQWAKSNLGTKEVTER